MGEPPRLPAIYLPWEENIAYFVTLCVRDRLKVLPNDTVFEAVKGVFPRIRRWYVIAGVIMPEHTHWLIAPAVDRDLSVGDFSNAFKRLLRKELGTQSWEWRRGCFDRLLRSDESAQSKWLYVRENPVRHGLVQRSEEWPYYLDFDRRWGS